MTRTSKILHNRAFRRKLHRTHWFLAAPLLLVGTLSATSSVSAATIPRHLTIAIENMSTQGEWFNQDYLGELNQVKQFKGKVTLREADANDSLSTEISQIHTLIAEHPNVLLIDHTPSSPALRPEVAAALKEGITVVGTGTEYLDMRHVIQVSQYNTFLATASLNNMARYLHNKGNIVVIWVGAMDEQEQRISVLHGWLKTHPAIHVIAEYGNASDATLPETIAETKAILSSHHNINAFWVTWDEFGTGVYDAEQAAHTHVPIFSTDVTDQDITKIRPAGSPWMSTTAADAYTYGAIAVRAGIDAALGVKVPTWPKWIYVPQTLITKTHLPAPGESVHAWFSKIDPRENTMWWTPQLKRFVNS